MNERLQKIIEYKTGGKQTDFAELLGWSPQYLAKLLKGESFGLTPIIKILETFQEVDARWFLFGTGEMLGRDGINIIRQATITNIEKILRLDRFLNVMTPDELWQYELICSGAKVSYFSEDTFEKWETLLNKTKNVD